MSCVLVRFVLCGSDVRSWFVGIAATHRSSAGRALAAMASSRPRSPPSPARPVLPLAGHGARAPLAAAGDFASVEPDALAAHGWMVAGAGRWSRQRDAGAAAGRRERPARHVAGDDRHADQQGASRHGGSGAGGLSARTADDLRNEPAASAAGEAP